MSLSNTKFQVLHICHMSSKKDSYLTDSVSVIKMSHPTKKKMPHPHIYIYGPLINLQKSTGLSSFNLRLLSYYIVVKKY